VVQRVADCLGRRAAGGEFGYLLFEPDTHFRDKRSALGLAQRQPISGAVATDARLDLVERSNALQCFRRDRRLRLGQVVKASAHMAPTKRQRNGGFGGLGAD
jgi:hypothetical protein